MRVEGVRAGIVRVEGVRAGGVRVGAVRVGTEWAWLVEVIEMNGTDADQG